VDEWQQREGCHMLWAHNRTVSAVKRDNLLDAQPFGRRDY
jgi:hypothetical protein